MSTLNDHFSAEIGASAASFRHEDRRAQREKTFADILYNWERFHGSEAFLRITRLDSCLSPEQWRSLASDADVPSVALANHLIGVLLQDRAFIADHPAIIEQVETLRAATEAAVRAGYQPVIDVPDRALAELRLAVAKKLYNYIMDCAPSPGVKVPESTRLAYPAQLLTFFRHCRGLERTLLQQSGTTPDYIGKLEHGEHPVSGKMLRNLQKALSLSPAETRLAAQACFPALDIQWLKKQEPRDHQPGWLCAAARSMFGWSQEELSNKSGVSKTNIANIIEHGGIVTPRIMEKIIHAFERADDILPKAYRWFGQEEKTVLRRGEKAPFVKALDAAWLSRQLPEKRAGFLVAACRVKMGWSQEELGEKIGVLRQGQDQYEKGECVISPETAGKYVKAFAEADRELSLRDQWFDSKMAVRLRQAADEYRSGAIEPAPTLGASVIAMRTALGHSQDSLSKVSGVSTSAIAAIEHGKPVKRDTVRKLVEYIEKAAAGGGPIQPLREAYGQMHIIVNKPRTALGGSYALHGKPYVLQESMREAAAVPAGNVLG